MLHPYFAENDFWCQVFWRPTQRPGPAFYSLGKPKVCHLEDRSTYTVKKKKKAMCVHISL